MTLKIQRGRQFLAGDAATPLFDEKGKAGGYLSKAAEKLVTQELSITLRQPRGRTYELKTKADWDTFLAANASTKEQTASFVKKFGITFNDFVNMVDDAAASDDKGLNLDLRPTSELAKALSIDKVDHDYGNKLAKDAKISLTGANDITGEAIAVGTPTIGASILDKPISGSWQRDRAEQESWADFKMGDGAGKKFKENIGVSVFEKLYQPKPDDLEAVALAEKFTLPIHLEIASTGADGKPVFQDKDEMFRETYFDDKSGALSNAGASVRARVRFDDKPPFPVRRVLVQGKEGRNVDESGNSQVHKFEERFESYSNITEQQAQDMLRSGLGNNGTPLKPSQMLYQLAKDKGTLPPDGNLRLEAKYTVLQKRRRSHMVIESLSTVKSNQTKMKTEMEALKTAGTPVPEGMTRLMTKLDSQVAFMEKADGLLRKYRQTMPSGEGFIISADRYSVYDPSARKEVPTDIDDESGRIGRGLHVEAEWDTASSDPFENAVDEIKKQMAATPAPTPEALTVLESDLKELEGIRSAIRKDVEATVDVLKQRLTKAGLELDPVKKSKDERASDFSKDPKKPVFWI